MEFVSADRSGDSEFEAGLKNYNFGIQEANIQRTKDIKNARDKEKKDIRDIASGEVEQEIKSGAGQASELAGAKATFDSWVKSGEAVAAKAKQAQQTAGEIAQNLQANNPTTEVPDTAEEAPATTETGVNEAAGAGAELEAGAEAGAEGAGLASKLGGIGLKGIGAVGAIAGMGMAIESDENGGWAKKSLADKIGNVAEIGGAGLDLAGLVLEATPLAPVGLALQGLGTLAQIGSGIEGEISSASQATKAKGEEQQEEQETEQEEQPEQKEISGVSQAGAGGLAVARQQQN
jgi:hypothetical protein